ncbi:MAG TPA: carboxypeptidase-like regulatory domain-containing protein, partial [Emticicia sp.]
MNQLLKFKRYLKTWALCLLILGNCQLLPASAFAAKHVAAAKQRAGQISGRVTDTKGEPLAGASIRIIGQQISASADGDGRFTLNAPAGTHTIEASFISFASQRKTVTVRDGGSTTADFTLTLESNALNEVVVVGY